MNSRYVAGIVSGIAMIAALIFLKESNPLIVDEEGNPRKVKLESRNIQKFIRSRTNTKAEEEDKSTPYHFTDVDVFCFRILHSLDSQCVRF